jgi:mono/diheme cytochrome c family protein
MRVLGLAFRRAALALGVFFLAAGAAQAAYKAPPSPEAPEKGDYWLGEEVYKEICFSCHGLKGDGRGPNWKASRPRPQVFTSRLMRRMTDEYIFAVVKYGKMNVLKERMNGFKLKLSRPTAMPSFGEVLEDAQIRRLIAWERGFTTGRQARDAEMKEIFEAACVQCHGKAGLGNGERPVGSQDPARPFVSEIQPPPMNYTLMEQMERFDEEFLFWLIKLGRIDVSEQKDFNYMQAYGHVLKDEEIWGVVRYVREAFINGKPRAKK